jgi:hypothetical protein
MGRQLLPMQEAPVGRQTQKQHCQYSQPLASGLLHMLLLPKQEAPVGQETQQQQQQQQQQHCQ